MTTIPQTEPSFGANEWLEVVRRNVSNLKFGSVQITVHDGKVTQVESVEKTRFTTARDAKRTDPK